MVMTGIDGHEVRPAESRKPRSRVVGRSAELRSIVDALSAGSSVLLSGGHGMGKTFLADAVDRSLRSSGVQALRLRGTAAGGGHQLYALKAALGVGHTAVTAQSVLAEATKALNRGRTATDRVPVVIVDDIHLLDGETADWVARLVYAKRVALLATLSPHPRGSRSESVAAAMTLANSLWIEGHADRIDLAPLTDEHVTELVLELTEQRRLDLATITAIRLRSAGVPLLVRELTLDAQHGSGAPEASDPFVRSGTGPSTRILDLVSQHLDSLTNDQLHGLALLGRLDRVSQRRAIQLLGAADLQVLFNQELVTRGPGRDGLLRADPLRADAAATLADPALLQEMSRTLAGHMIRDVVSGERLTVCESLFLASHWLDDGRLDELAPAYGTEAVFGTLLTGAAKANSCGLFSLGVSLARAALELKSTVPAAVQLSVALALQGRVQEAIAALEKVEGDRRDRRESNMLLRWWTFITTWITADLDAATRLAERAAAWHPDDPAFAAEVEMVTLSHTIPRMSWANGAEHGERIARDESAHVSTRIRAAGIGAVGHAFLGNFSRAQGLLGLGRTLNRGARSDGRENRGMAVYTSLTEAFIAITLSDGIQALSDELRQWMREALEDHDLAFLVYLGLIAANVEDLRGNLPAAESELRGVDSRFPADDVSVWRGWTRVEHARVLAELGEAPAAAALLADANSTAVATAPWLRYLSDRAEQHIRAAAGDASAARAIALRIADAQGAGSPVIRTRSLYDAFWHGTPAADVRDGITAAVAATDNALLVTMGRHVAAVADHDGPALDAVASTFASLQMFVHAAEAARGATEMHIEKGLRMAALASRSACSEYEAAAQGQLLAGRRAESRIATLTHRESEIAHLAAKGLSNRQIASTLFLSVRTVESHLYQARAKLGAASRRDLAAIFDVSD